MDDGWFGERNDDSCSLGDWDVNEKKLPGGLKPLADGIKAEQHLKHALLLAAQERTLGAEGVLQPLLVYFRLYGLYQFVVHKLIFCQTGIP